MRTSVALCTYNGEAFLTKQLESILHQAVPVEEIVITDDNSKDGTASIIKLFQQQYPGIIRFETNNPGLGAKKNFEKALSLCTGDIIFLSDQDDIWQLDKVEKIVAYFEQNSHIEAVFTDATLIDDNETPTNSTLFQSYRFGPAEQKAWKEGNALFDMLSGLNRVTGATMAIRKTLLNRTIPFKLPQPVWHDAWLSLYAAAEGRLGWINKPLINYRVHMAQQVGLGGGTTVSTMAGLSFRELLRRMQEHETEWLRMTDILLATYPLPALLKFKKNKLQLLRFLTFRLSLPQHLFPRILMVIRNLPLYFSSPGKPLLSIMRDTLKKP